MFPLPFDKELYKKAFQTSLLIGIIGWGVLFLIFGELTTADIFGMLISIPIFAYLLHLIWQF